MDGERESKESILFECDDDDDDDEIIVYLVKKKYFSTSNPKERLVVNVLNWDVIVSEN